MKSFFALSLVVLLSSFACPVNPDCSTNPLSASGSVVASTSTTSTVRMTVTNPSPTTTSYMVLQWVVRDTPDATDAAFAGGYTWTGNYTNTSQTTITDTTQPIDRTCDGPKYVIYRYFVRHNDFDPICPFAESAYKYGSVRVAPLPFSQCGKQQI